MLFLIAFLYRFQYFLCHYFLFWGDSAGVNNIGYSNVAIGRGALRNDVGGINLVAIGDSALYNNLVDVGEEEGLQNAAVKR